MENKYYALVDLCVVRRLAVYTYSVLLWNVLVLDGWIPSGIPRSLLDSR